ncbi:hypothetical protein PHYSODRAFT_305785 [Phytophthora sojae]|uniref:Uncharacterized protein n=1 Tax=Phytophthora sojae (strain P6497) TaxID=1094619 RepID=G5A6J8_PHYSP|nr:hypothetical protein PHYSODRAFT_305785 [Phytophthora sojae]EGZ08953.1 hypothetical protein PHYSODRAFT_305785 [Phytophthora sojae]|eukprot:XP_009535586.1 hypothetical protein PHYSODRAFT_305785 [Phytophthora sojae]
MERVVRVDDHLSPMLDEDALLVIMDEVWSELDHLLPQFELLGDDTGADKGTRRSFSTIFQNAELKSLLRQNPRHSCARPEPEQAGGRAAPNAAALNEHGVPYDATQDDALFRKMASNVDDQNRNMEEVLRLVGLQEGNPEVTNAFICQSKGQRRGNLLESRTRILLPFASQTMVKAFWRNVESDEGATLKTKQAARNPVRTLLHKYCAMVVISNNPLVWGRLGLASRIAVQKYDGTVVVGEYNYTMRMVTKPFIEKDRVVQAFERNRRMT